jgi:hypothetical protein
MDGGAPTPEQQSVLQLQNDLRMKPRSQMDEQELVQLHSNTKGRNRKHRANNAKALSADTFDEGDGSTHNDNDVDFDLAQA